ncbi:MAG: glycosyltransferase family 2 protein [Flavobacteriales bacterium]|nr:glycosyltransferase family 2 protein [Flavobacteriales bacterium]
MKLRKPGVSVIVCCYNSEKRLVPTLHHLFKQRVNPLVNWEIIIVNNNSNDATASVALQLHEQQGNSITFRVIDEPKPGLSNARNAGFLAAEYEFVLMVDDDNWLSENYVETVYSHLQNNPKAAMVGGLGEPELEEAAPSWFNDYASCYATGPQAKTGAAPLKHADELYGAGCAIRLTALEHIKHCGFKNILSDRTGASLMSGGDTELCLALRMAGFELLYDERIHFKHFLPKGRVTWLYLRKLFQGFGQSKALTDVYISTMRNEPIPTNQRFPFWFNRTWFLVSQLRKNLALLVRSKMQLMEGNAALLQVLAQVGQLRTIIKHRNELIGYYEYAHQFRLKAKQNAPKYS